MPSGQVHSSTSIGLSVGICLGYAAAYQAYPNELLSFGAGALSGVLFTPDWDVDAGNISNWYIRKAFSRLGEALWSYWIRPYAVAIEHRSFLSHFPIICTLFRLTYLAFPFIILILPKFRKELTPQLFLNMGVVQAISIVAIKLNNIDPMILFYFLLGQAASDTLHILFDIIF